VEGYVEKRMKYCLETFEEIYKKIYSNAKGTSRLDPGGFE